MRLAKVGGQWISEVLGFYIVFETDKWRLCLNARHGQVPKR